MKRKGSWGVLRRAAEVSAESIGSRSRVARIEIALCRAWLNWNWLSCDSGLVYVWSTSVLQWAYTLELTQALFRTWDGVPDPQPPAQLVTKTQQPTIAKWGICSPFEIRHLNGQPIPGARVDYCRRQIKKLEKPKRKYVTSLKLNILDSLQMWPVLGILLK